MVGAVILHDGNWSLWDQVSFRAPAAAGEEQPWAAQPGLVGRRWEGHVGTLWLHHEPALFWSQPNQHLLLCWFLWISLIHLQKWMCLPCTVKLLLQPCTENKPSPWPNSLQTIPLPALPQSEGWECRSDKVIYRNLQANPTEENELLLCGDGTCAGILSTSVGIAWCRTALSNPQPSTYITLFLCEVTDL